MNPHGMDCQCPEHKLDLPALKKLCEAATPGPWNPFIGGCIRGGEYREYSRGCAQSQVALCTLNDIDEVQRDANQSFIVTARTAMPKLIEEVEKLQILCAKIRDDDNQNLEAMAKENQSLRGQNDRHIIIQEAVTKINKDLLDKNERLRELLGEGKSELEAFAHLDPAVGRFIKRIDQVLGGDEK